MDPKDCSGKVEDLTEGQLKTLHDWEEKFRSKYPEVGKVGFSDLLLASERTDLRIPGSPALPEELWPPSPAVTTQHCSDFGISKVKQRTSLGFDHCLHIRMAY